MPFLSSFTFCQSDSLLSSPLAQPQHQACVCLLGRGCVFTFYFIPCLCTCCIHFYSWFCKTFSQSSDPANLHVLENIMQPRCLKMLCGLGQAKTFISASFIRILDISYACVEDLTSIAGFFNLFFIVLLTTEGLQPESTKSLEECF